jgi:hypothetical protein
MKPPTEHKMPTRQKNMGVKTVPAACTVKVGKNFGIFFSNLLSNNSSDRCLCWEDLGLLPKTPTVENGILQRCTYHYPFDHQNQAILGPVSAWMGDHPNKYNYGCC